MPGRRRRPQNFANELARIGVMMLAERLSDRLSRQKANAAEGIGEVSSAAHASQRTLV
jgi:hypothetical protein